MFSRQLEEQAEQCIRLAYQCQNKNVERFLRLLAVDLMLAAQHPPQPARKELPGAPSAPPVSKFADELAELGRLSRAAADPDFKYGSASRA